MIEASGVGQNTRISFNEVVAFQREEQARQRGEEMVGNFDGNTDVIVNVIREAVAEEDRAVRSGLVRGAAYGIAKTLFPNSGTTYDPVDMARLDYETRAIIVMNRAVGAIRNSTEYPRLEIGRIRRTSA